MKVKSDLSGVRVGDVLESFRHGEVTVVFVEASSIIHGKTRTGFTNTWDMCGVLVTSPRGALPDLWYPGVQIIPTAPPKRMTRVPVQRWIGLYREHDGEFVSLVCSMKESLPPGFLGEIKHILWEIEVEDE